MVNTLGMSEVQQELLTVLTAAGCPITAIELRIRANTSRPVPLVTEQVYRRLVALERRGLIRRAPTPCRRDTSWQPTEAAARKGFGS